MAKPWQNKSGCNGPTAYAATKPISEEEQRVADLVRVIKLITRWAGFDLLNRMEFRERNSGRMYK